MQNINNSWYSIIISLLIIWFLLVLTTGTFLLVLNEMKDNRGMGDYIKAYAWAESAQELALLKIKQNWYWYYEKVDHNINNNSIYLASDNLDISNFHPRKDVFISYDIWSKVNSYNWYLGSLEYHIIPLFYIDELLNENKLTWLNLSILDWVPSNLSWNIIWKNNWLSWNWSSPTWIKKSLNSSNSFTYWQEDINTFLSSSDTNYLVLFNTSNSIPITYKLSSLDSLEYFSKPETEIISSAQVWWYRQNLSTKLDNTKFLNMLKYSIYSN